MLYVQRDGLAVDVLHRRHDERHGGGTGAHGHGQRHRRQHVRGVVFLVDGLVAGDRPAGRFNHIHVKAILFIKAHGMGHDDGGGTGDGDKADIQLGLFQGTHFVLNRSLGCFHGEHGGQYGRGGTATHGAHKGATTHFVAAEDRSYHRILHRAVDDRLTGIHCRVFTRRHPIVDSRIGQLFKLLGVFMFIHLPVCFIGTVTGLT